MRRTNFGVGNSLARYLVADAAFYGHGQLGQRIGHITNAVVGCSADQEMSGSSARMRLRAMPSATRIDNGGESRSKYHNAFHHAGTTMIESPRKTAGTARLANISGAIGRNGSQNLAIFSSLTPGTLIRPYLPPVRIGVRTAPGHSTETCTPWRLACAPQRLRDRDDGVLGGGVAGGAGSRDETSH
jgi:hypothetical protein